VPVRSTQTLRFNVMFASTFRGRYQDRLEFVFEDRALLQRFVIVRTVRAISGEPGAYADLQPSAPYVPRKWAPRTRESNVIPGVRPPALTAVPWVVPLPDAIVPHALADAVSPGPMRDVIGRIRQSFLPSVLNGDTYARHFKTLLWVEEVRME
jgi:helicase MOV-10